MNSARVAVVGAGLAGLNCAARLAELGFSPSIYEASDGIGGRARTDSVDGFRLDRGFQVLLTAYPEAQRTFDYASLGLGEFVPGAQVRQGGSFAVFADPTRVPRSAPASLKSPVAGVADLLRLYRMKRDLATNEPRKILERRDIPALESLRQRGFTNSMIESFFRPFFGGVFIDPDLVTSSRLMEIYFRCFSDGSAALPRGGIGALAAQLADRLPEGTINLNSPVSRVDPDGLELEDGGRIDAEAVVVATEESGAATLCGLEVSAAERLTTCLYFDAPESEIRGSWLILSPAGEGPINELAIPSSVAEGYAPPGRSLVSVSVVGEQCDRTDLLGATRTQLAAWFGESVVAGWRHLRSYRIEQALPGFDPGRLRVDGLDPRLDSGVYVCGDHRETPSIQGALVSGRKTAAAVAAAGDRTD